MNDSSNVMLGKKPTSYIVRQILSNRIEFWESPLSRPSTEWSMINFSERGMKEFLMKTKLNLIWPNSPWKLEFKYKCMCSKWKWERATVVLTWWPWPGIWVSRDIILGTEVPARVSESSFNRYSHQEMKSLLNSLIIFGRFILIADREEI